jgi:hypothetical protein
MFDRTLKLLSSNNTVETRMQNIINPFSLYYLCNHYYGDETHSYNIKIPIDKTNLLDTELSVIKEFDIVHVQVDYFVDFCEKILDKLQVKIILTTGQWHLPQLHKSNLTDKVMKHPNILLWFSQNPIYENNDKYFAFPYGIAHYNLEEYVNALILNSDILKTERIVILPMNNNTHICRKRLPCYQPIHISIFYTCMMT